MKHLTTALWTFVLVVTTLTVTIVPIRSAEPSAPTVTLPATASGKVGSFIIVSATTTGKSVGWFVADEGLNLFPPSLLKDSSKAVVTSERAGTYRLVAWTSNGDVLSDPVVCLITVGDPLPPGPGPGPGPSNGLTTALQTAYNLDSDADRAASLAKLQAAYRTMSVTVPPTIRTNADAIAWIKTGLTAQQLKNLHGAITTELTAAFGPTSTAPLTPAALAAELGKIANALQGVK